MSNGPNDILLDDIQEEIQEQAEFADVSEPHKDTNDDQAQYATLYDPRLVEGKILVSISKNINTMAEAIKESEAQKHSVRAKCVNWFIGIMVFLTLLATTLIIADTFFGVTVKIEFLISVILAILADVFAIVHTLIKYMTNVENYAAYGNLIDNLLKYIGRNS